MKYYFVKTKEEYLILSKKQFFESNGYKKEYKEIPTLKDGRAVPLQLIKQMWSGVQNFYSSHYNEQGLKEVMNKLGTALWIAMTIHEKQKNKAGEPYLLHVLSVASLLPDNVWYLKVLALLHDTLEDAEENGFTKTQVVKMIQESALKNTDILSSISWLTRKKEENYWEYINTIACCGDNMSKTVKMADLLHNMDLNRLDIVTKSDVNRSNKYVMAYYYLLGASQCDNPFASLFLPNKKVFHLSDFEKH